MCKRRETRNSSNRLLYFFLSRFFFLDLSRYSLILFWFLKNRLNGRKYLWSAWILFNILYTILFLISTRYSFFELRINIVIAITRNRKDIMHLISLSFIFSCFSLFKRIFLKVKINRKGEFQKGSLLRKRPFITLPFFLAFTIYQPLIGFI